MLADVIRARAAYHALDPEHEALSASLEALADYVEAQAPGSSRETLTTLETQAKRYEIVFGFPDLGGRASTALDVAADDHAAAMLREFMCRRLPAGPAPETKRRTRALHPRGLGLPQVRGTTGR